MIYFVSDTHYGHKNIVLGTSQWTDKRGCRAFSTIPDHDNWVVNVINSRVGRGDTLWHLGDWSFGGKDRIKEFRDQIDCEKVHMILGNHDHHIAKDRMGLLFESVQQYKELIVGGLSLVLMHYPIESWINMERGAMHLHGHVHGQGTVIPGRYDVGVDALGITSVEDLHQFPHATTQRHTSIEGGNRFGN